MRFHLALSLVFLPFALTAEPIDLRATDAAATALRRGGLVLYLRHPETERTQADAELLDFARCGTQRNLSMAGRETAAAIGAALRKIGAQIGHAVTSEYCRARETAALIGVKAETDGALNDGGRMLAAGPASPMAEALRARLRSVPQNGTNTLIIAHRPNLVDGAGQAFADMAEGEMVAFQPGGAPPGFAAVLRIRPAEWDAVAP